MSTLKLKFRATIYQDFIAEAESREELKSKADAIARRTFLEVPDAVGYEVFSLDDNMLGFNFDG